MKKRERGILTVEASIVLTLSLMFVLFIFGFARVYRAQNLISHGTLQSADAIAMESYLRETALQADVADIVYLASSLTDSTTLSADQFESLRSADLPKLAKEKFVAALASNEEQAEQVLKKAGIKNGLAGLDFSQSYMDLERDDVVVVVSYALKMQFPVFGANEISSVKTAKAKTFGEILFELTTGTNNPSWGTTSGDAKVTYGTEVTITATPKYGYKFVKWHDGVTDNPRTVKVTDAMNYKAIFERDTFGVNIEKKIVYNESYKGMEHENYGTVQGDHNYLYLDTATIKAVPSSNYEFVGWDDNGDGAVDSTNATRTITVDKVYYIKAIFKPRTYKIQVSVNNSAYGTAQVKQGSNSGAAVNAEYGSKVQLIATSKNTAVYSFAKWNNNNTNPSIPVVVQGNTTYQATFQTNTYTVNFYNGSTLVHTAKVVRNSSINASKAHISTSMAPNTSKSGATFDKWTCNGSVFTADTAVKGDLSVYAAWKYTITLNANGGTIEGLASKSYVRAEGLTFNFDSYKPTRAGYSFNGWYAGNTRYSGNKTINSGISVTASWSCTHPSRYEERTGALCTGGTIIYRCTQCHVELGRGAYGGIGHSWTGRCNIRHYVNWFNGQFSGGCGGYHTPGRSYCQTCVHCSALRSGYNWCASPHMLNSARAKPRRTPPSHNIKPKDNDIYE